MTGPYWRFLPAFILGFALTTAAPLLAAVAVHAQTAASEIVNSEAEATTKVDAILERGREIIGNVTMTIVGDQDPEPVSDLSVFVDRSPKDRVRVLPVLGTGGLRNLADLLFLRGVDAAIVMGSSLDELKRRDPQLHTLAAGRLRYLLRLYNAELHVVARRDRIRQMSDLAGETVNFISADGSADVVGQHVLSALGIKVVPVHVDLARGLEQVADGSIAATIVFAGKPIAELRNLPQGSPLHLVPVDSGLDRVDSSYLPALIQHADYPNLVADDGDAVITLAGPLLLAAYDWPDRPQAGQKIRQFLDSFADGFVGQLGDGRHPKWRDVNIAADMPGWQRDATAAAWLLERANRANPGDADDSELAPAEDGIGKLLTPPLAADGGASAATGGLDAGDGLGFAAP